MRVEIERAAPSQRPVLENLASLYLHDFSEVFRDPPGPDGRFVYERLPLYFREAGRTPFLVRADGRLAGFALVSRGSVISGAADVFDLSEFFVVRGLRRTGVGSTAAAAVFSAFPGAWEVRALERNPGAAAFWAQAISRHTAGDFQVAPWQSAPDLSWQVFRFVQPGTGAPAET